MHVVVASVGEMKLARRTRCAVDQFVLGRSDMFDLTRSGDQPLLDAAAKFSSLPAPPGGAPWACRITVESTDMTCDDRVHDLFNRSRRALRKGARHVIIDLDSVIVADTKIVACLVALYQIARSAAARLEVRLSTAVKEIARVCRLEKLVTEMESGVRRTPGSRVA
jgi:anti-anti-sigma regulatory factor